MTKEPRPPLTGPISRRDLLQLLGVAAIGWGVSQALKATTPVGTDVSGNAVARSVLLDVAAPHNAVRAADLTVAVFTDYLCPICRVTDAALLAAVAKDAKVRILYKDWPILSDASTRAARVALASQPQGLYERVHVNLMRERRVLDESVLRGAVEAAGGDWARTLHDLGENAAAIDRQLARNRVEAFGLGLSGTPGFLVGGLLINQGLDEAGFRTAFARARAIAVAA